MNWSEEQKKIIGLKNKSILVSAAAGSGKTTVMVERIIDMISDENNGIDLNELLVMTFTNAAADGMRQKIGKALRNRLAAEPDNKRLKLQSAMLPRASISTIHSFCQRLIKQHYQQLDIDPGFRLLDEAESVMLRGDVLTAILEDKYTENADEIKDEAFKKLVNTFEEKRFDSKLTSVINNVYSFIMAQAWPEKTIEAWQAECIREKTGDYKESLWYKEFEDAFRKEAQIQAELLFKASEVCDAEDGPAKYKEIIEADLEKAETLSRLSGYENIREYLGKISFGRLPNTSFKKDGVDEGKKEFVKDLRNDFKKWTASLLEGEFLLSEDELSMQIKGSAELSYALLELTAEFAKKYSELKKERNVLDFNDLEHMALQVLYKEDADGNLIPSELADELAMSLKEIMIDEYQDSNYVQEAIINALSAERFGRHDVFTVGDVKQSIYRFRNARPELFNRRYETFSDDEAYEDVRIELNANYRSRKEVIDSVNTVFLKIMSKEAAGIEYDERAMLKCGADYPFGNDCKTELLFLDPEEIEENVDNADNADNTEESKEADETLKAEELEYKLIANRINALVKGSEGNGAFTVRDAASGQMRPVRFSDIAILIRKKKSAEPLIDMLRKNGVPAYFEDSKGYFDAAEVRMMLSFLNVLDDPLQDIPLVSVLKGPIGEFTDNELALIRTAFVEAQPEDRRTEPGDYYRALEFYAENADDEALKKKAAFFIAELTKFRDMADVMPVHLLLNEIYIKTGFYEYASAMPLGETRQKNLDILMKKAEDYAGTGYQGLFNFVRYIETLKKYDTDYGEAPSAAGNKDVVNITTIHGSKGLEYPVVILARAAESFEGRGNADSSIAVEDEGIGMDYTDLESGIVYPGLKKLFLKKKKKSEEAAEEQRLLYVAMTRAMEKLIITGEAKGAEEKLEKLKNKTLLFENAACTAVSEGQKAGSKLSTGVINKCKTYLDWIILSCADNDYNFDIKTYTVEDLITAAKEEQEELRDRYLELKRFLLEDGKIEDEAAKTFSEKLDKVFAAEYAYEEETRLKPKISVSEIKKMAIEELESGMKVYDISDNAVPEPLYIPAENASGDINNAKAARNSFGSNVGEKPNRGALKGTAFHRAMELLSYEGSAEEQLKEIMESEKMPADEKELLDKEAVLTFLESDIAKRMTAAKKNGTLKREQHFMAGFPADTLKKDQQSKELQILQGIIDAYFEEDGEIILVDYKTDKINDPEELKERYRIQLELYSRALEQLTHKNVRERIIYSTFLKQKYVL